MKKEKISGILLILLGLIMLLNVVGITNITIFFAGWWTFFIIIPSLFGMINERKKSYYVFSFLLGIILLAASQNIISWLNVWIYIIIDFLIVKGMSLLTKK